VGRCDLLNLLVLMVVAPCLVRTVVQVAVLGGVLILPLLLLLLLLMPLMLMMLGLERLGPPQGLLCSHAVRLARVFVGAPLGLLELHLALLLEAVVAALPRLFALALKRGDLTSVERCHAAAAAAAAAAAVETLGVYHDERPRVHVERQRHAGLLVLLQRL